MSQPLRPSSGSFGSFSAAAWGSTASQNTNAVAVAPSDNRSTIVQINSALETWKETRGHLLWALREFNKANEDPKASPNLNRADADSLQPLLQFLTDPSWKDAENTDILLQTLLSLKILSRKRENRLQFTDEAIQALASIASTSKSDAISSECSSVILNICYEKKNVESLLRTDAVSSLIAFLVSGTADLQAVAAGAIQSVCYQELGRKTIKDLGAIPDLVALLSSSNSKVQARVVGAIHNITTDAKAITIIRKSKGIPPLISLLKSTSLPTACAAAGAIQNISRDPDCQKAMLDAGAVGPLTTLLFCADVSSQSCALGALLNILGPEMDEEHTPPSRVALRKLLENSMVLGMVYHSMFDSDDGSSRPNTAQNAQKSAEPLMPTSE
eukprot:TRINITY_DN9194_c0_g1_i2.p1 TRINITY_DN9194_c0_g1~~TRINITY_DN9194_c0_g1_i2.p1  ORF type:complete len:386 (+),score=78.79 TRINITY_DN9194_c0_g1_i2:74-1231(+)